MHYLFLFMYLAYICNSFIFNLFLTFSLPFTFICVYKAQTSSWTFVWEDRVAVQVRKVIDMLKSQMWRNS